MEDTTCRLCQAYGSTAIAAGFFLLCSAIGCCFSVASAAVQEIAVKNLDTGGNACMIRVPVVLPWTECSADGCDMPAPAGSSLNSIHLGFSCLPLSAPTGFENPPSYGRVESIRSGKWRGQLSEIDSIDLPKEERTRELNFCIYGKLSNFCGYARTLRLKDGKKADAAGIVKLLIRRIELE